jgi:hypothetical protein
MGYPHQGIVRRLAYYVTILFVLPLFSIDRNLYDRSMINHDEFGISFSVKQCRNFGIDTTKTLQWLLVDAGFKRFRLMSYWDEHEKQQGIYDFTSLDAQVQAISAAEGYITLCLGARQPRWPENHWPDWAWSAHKVTRSKALLAYIEAVVNRYKSCPNIISYQLENEALLTDFGERSEVDIQRLRQEYDLVKKLDPARAVIMTTSTSWGIPIRQPIPDIVGFSFYNIVYRAGAYHRSLFYPWVHKLRKFLILLIHRKATFIHELQLEPWGPAAVWKMSPEEQDKSMNIAQIANNIRLGKAIKAAPYDLWGAEWWYWRHARGDDTIWDAVRQAVSTETV